MADRSVTDAAVRPSLGLTGSRVALLQAPPRGQEAFPLAGKETHRIAVALVVVAIACSATSLGLLVFRPVSTGNLRTWLNIAALLLLITSTTNLVRITSGRDPRS
jgi:hypothetical protein